MYIAVPQDLPVDDSEVVVQSPRGDKSAAEAAAESEAAPPAVQKVDENKARSFIRDNNVIPLLNELLTDLFLHLPDDPLDHMTKWLLRHDPEENDASTKAVELQQQHHAAVQYSSRFKLPQLFDELLAALIEAEPEDHPRFAMSWLRWNKKGFIARHKPPGYKALIEQMETDKQK